MRHHVLLVGIDSYPSNPLFGCVNDIDAIQRLLIDRVGVPRAHITRLAAPHADARPAADVPPQLPTLANLRAALERLGTADIAPGDHVFIYYSGHGTQTRIDDGRGKRFSREALVPVDDAESGPLFDWELNHLIAGIAARTHAVTVVLDACCSAGVFRGDRARPPAARNRFKRDDGLHTRAASSEVSLSTPRGIGKALGSVRRCQVIAACRDDERAQEASGADGRIHGELTRSLLRHLDGIHDDELRSLRWGRIWRAVAADVRTASRDQQPWLSGSFDRPMFGPFEDTRSLGGGDGRALDPDDAADHGYAVVQVPDGYQFDVGTVNGITVGARIGVYGPTPPVFPPVGSAADLEARLATVEITRAERSSSIGSGGSGGSGASLRPLPPGARGRLVAPGKAARLRVGLVPDDAKLAARIASDLIELVPAADAELVLVRRADGWELTDDVFGDDQVPDRAILALIPHGRIDRARAMVEHYHAYTAPLRLADASKDLPGRLQISALACGQQRISAEAAQHPDLPELDVDGDGVYEIAHGGRACFVVHNISPIALSVSLVDCGSTGRVLVLGERRLAAHSQHVFWADETLGKAFVASCPDRRSVGIDRLVAIGTTRTDRSLAHLALRTSFADVLDGVTRGTLVSRARSVEPETEQWTATVTSVRTRRARPASW